MRISGLLVLAALIPAPLAVGAVFLDAPLVVLNTSPSEPIGLYRRVAAQPQTGDLIAFRPPQTAMAYLRRSQPGRARGSILKGVAAGAGAQVCASERLVVEGRVLGPIAARDRAGRLLPRWRGCRRLVAGEYVVFSNRIPNSFDSRYYGPVHRRDILGVYAPIWIWDA
ncbi:conjugal transfer protein [Caulobacter flavus]|jgi:conjugative transfer signal peptidase TraF|uniref:Conjugal transfer protein n=1 Tax=Caulobacter flavus TaxID=1679497 RepID=A0A2N5CQ48_9CAUL|nr:S26 family signal peptidase [Caulobacter flavus]PLR09262.1 conjugal transfer protein [Caulobacter flavus]